MGDASITTAPENATVKLEWRLDGGMVDQCEKLQRKDNLLWVNKYTEEKRLTNVVRQHIGHA